MITQPLAEITQRFLNDHANMEKLMQNSAWRAQTIPNIQPALHEFIQGYSTFAQLSAVLTMPQNGWYVGENNSGYFNISLRKFAKNYIGSNNEASEQSRALLQDLNVRTLGQKIEQCYTFLLQEKNHLQDTGLGVHSTISPISSAFIMSQFAHWLDPQGELLISTQYVRKSTVTLVRGGLLPNHTELKPRGSDFIIRTSAQYGAFLSLFDAVRDAAPQITSLLPLPYWREYFIWWAMDHRKELIISR